MCVSLRALVSLIVCNVSNENVSAEQNTDRRATRTFGGEKKQEEEKEEKQQRQQQAANETKRLARGTGVGATALATPASVPKRLRGGCKFACSASSNRREQISSSSHHSSFFSNAISTTQHSTRGDAPLRRRKCLARRRGRESLMRPAAAAATETREHTRSSKNQSLELSLLRPICRNHRSDALQTL